MQRYKLFGMENALAPDEEGEFVYHWEAMEAQRIATTWDRRRIYLEAHRRASTWPDGKQGITLADLGEILGIR